MTKCVSPDDFCKISVPIFIKFYKDTTPVKYIRVKRVSLYGSDKNIKSFSLNNFWKFEGLDLKGCLYGAGLARVLGLARFAEISPPQKIWQHITYVLSYVYMRTGPARLDEIPPLLTRDLG